MNSRAQILAILYVLGTFTFVSVKADIIILQYGDIITGQVLKQNEDGVDIQTSSGKVHWPAKLIKEVRKAGEESTTNRIPTWVRIISQLTTNTWVHDIKQIPATVIDNGILKDVPYISFRCNSGGYEMNIYGDLDKPACIEIGVVGYLVKNDGAKFNCVQFISSVLSQDDDKEAVRLLGWTPKGIRKSNGLTVEST